MSDSPARLNVPADHPAYAGHFPGQPIVPGVLLLEWIMSAMGHPFEHPARLARIPSAKFLKPVRPGEILQLEWSIDPSSSVLRFSAIAADGANVVTGTFELERTASRAVPD